MPNATVRANAQAMPETGPLSIDTLASEMLRAVDDLAKVGYLMSAAMIIAGELNIVELDPLMTVLSVAEDQLDAVHDRLDAVRLGKSVEE